jgi:hypothetical protein
VENLDSTHNARTGSSLGAEGRGNEVRGIGKMGAHLKCAPAASAHSDSKKASKVSFAWKRRNGVPNGKTFANALSFMARFACK